MKLNLIRCVAIASIITASTLAFAQQLPQGGGYAPVHGLKMYYEIHGQGQPLILIHGGLGSSDMFAAILPELSKGHKVIAVDLQAHGRTADVDRALSYEAMADDIAELIRYLGMPASDVMGYSVGGEVALRTAVQHPGVVRKLVIVSATYRRDGWYPEIIAGQSQLNSQTAEQMKQGPIYKSYAQIAPRPQDWPVLCQKMGNMFRQDYDWSADVVKIKLPVLLAFGDADAVRTASAVQFFELLGGGQRDGGWDGSGLSHARLAILPSTTHYTIFSSPQLSGVVTRFLDAPIQPAH